MARHPKTHAPQALVIVIIILAFAVAAFMVVSSSSATSVTVPTHIGTVTMTCTAVVSDQSGNPSNKPCGSTSGTLTLQSALQYAGQTLTGLHLTISASLNVTATSSLVTLYGQSGPLGAQQSVFQTNPSSTSFPFTYDVPASSLNAGPLDLFAKATVVTSSGPYTVILPTIALTLTTAPTSTTTTSSSSSSSSTTSSSSSSTTSTTSTSSSSVTSSSSTTTAGAATLTASPTSVLAGQQVTLTLSTTSTQTFYLYIQGVKYQAFTGNSATYTMSSCFSGQVLFQAISADGSVTSQGVYVTVSGGTGQCISSLSATLGSCGGVSNICGVTVTAMPSNSNAGVIMFLNGVQSNQVALQNGAATIGVGETTTQQTVYFTDSSGTVRSNSITIPAVPCITSYYVSYNGVLQGTSTGRPIIGWGPTGFGGCYLPPGYGYTTCQTLPSQNGWVEYGPGGTWWALTSPLGTFVVTEYNPCQGNLGSWTIVYPNTFS